MCTWHNRTTACKPLAGSGVIEGRSLAVQLHVDRVDTRTVDPWVVKIGRSALDQHDLELVVQIGQSTCLGTKGCKG